MNLGEFLSQMQIPQFNEIDSGNAKGTVRLQHPEVEVKTEKGLEKCTQTEIHIEYISFLGVLRDNPDLTFDALYSRAIKQYGFVNHAPIADLHLGTLEFFNRLGAVDIVNGKVGSRQMGPVYVFGIPERAGDAKFRLDDEGLKQIEVLSAKPKDLAKEGHFRQYFPEPSQ